MNILIFTLPNQIYATIVLRELVKHNFEIVGIVTSSSLARLEFFRTLWKTIKNSGLLYFCLRSLEQLHNRWLQLINPFYCSVTSFAKSHSIPLYSTKDVNAASFIETVATLEPDVIITLYFDQIIKKKLLAIPKYGCINVHRALLPKYRGPCSAFWQLALCESKSGTTIHFLDKGVDTGDIILQEEYEITPEDTHHTLCLKSAETTGRLLPDALVKLKTGTLEKFTQKEEASRFPFPTREASISFLRRGKRMF